MSSTALSATNKTENDKILENKTIYKKYTDNTKAIDKIY